MHAALRIAECCTGCEDFEMDGVDVYQAKRPRACRGIGDRDFVVLAVIRVMIVDPERPIRLSEAPEVGPVTLADLDSVFVWIEQPVLCLMSVRTPLN